MRHIAVLATLFAACDLTAAPDHAGEVDISVMALTLPGVTDAKYRITLLDSTGTVSWSTDLTSTQYGNGPGGDLTYIGPCDASGSGLNTVRLELLELVPLDPKEWANPGPMEQTFTCVENADTPVSFNVTILREAEAGFADISVNFEDIFCSAKVDCTDDQGAPLDLLHDENGQRMPSVVFAVTCANEFGSDPHILLDTPRIECGPQGGSWSFDPTQPGIAPLPGHPAQRQMVTAGASPGSTWEQIYWTLTFGNAPGALPADCRFVSAFTASNGPLPGNTTQGTAWPVVKVDVPLTDGQGAPVCTQHPLNGGNGLETAYQGPTTFPYALHRGPNGVAF